MTTIHIAPAVIAEMLAAAMRAAPLEACGLLAGDQSRVTRFYPLTNADASGVHFSVAPEEQFAAVKDMRTRNLSMLGIWHSHPATPARMSAEDLRLALTPGVAYVILSLAAPEESGLRAYEVIDGEPAEVELKALPEERSQCLT